MVSTRVYKVLRLPTAKQGFQDVIREGRLVRASKLIEEAVFHRLPPTMDGPFGRRLLLIHV